MTFNKETLFQRAQYLKQCDYPLFNMITDALDALVNLERKQAMTLQKYKRKPGNEVLAIQLMSSAMLTYKAWAGLQSANGGDWLVRRQDGETYTVEQKSFAATYKEAFGQLSGWFDKFTPVWAERAPCDGNVPTKEGKSAFVKDDYLCYNSADRTDGWCMAPVKFEALYEVDGN